MSSGEPKRVHVSRRVFTPKDNLMYALLTGLLCTSALFFFVGWFNNRLWKDDTLLAVVGTCIFGLYSANPVARWLLLRRMRAPVPCVPQDGLPVAMATTYVAGSESLQMLEHTLIAMKNVIYPHDSWLLDEGDSTEARALCERLGIHHFSRRHIPRYQSLSGVFQSRSKHGNYNAWLTEIGFERYAYVTGLDPDHIPSPDFLHRVLGYFEDPSIGYVQAAQAYYNQDASFIARGAAEETYDYYSTLQMASYGMGFPIVIGSHNTHRVLALREVGGFAPHDADDLLITMLYRERKWHGVYVPEILARGLAPVDWTGYLTQQRRWARSVLDIKLNVQPALSANMPAPTKFASYMHGLSYLQPGFMLTLNVSALLLIIWSGNAIGHAVDIVGLAVLAGSLFACHSFRQKFFLDPSTECGVHWNARLLRIAKAPFLLLALLDVLARRRFEYVMTSKVAGARGQNLLLAPFGGIAVLIIATWTIGVLRNSEYAAAVHLLAFAAVLSCLALITSGSLAFPAPFDVKLLAPQTFSSKSAGGQHLHT